MHTVHFSAHHRKLSVLFPTVQLSLLVDFYVQMSPGCLVLVLISLMKHKLITNEHKFIKNYGLLTGCFTRVPGWQIHAAEMSFLAELPFPPHKKS